MKLSIGENIKSLRRAQNVTQEELSLALGVSCQSVSRWEMGICYPDMELLPCIANYFGVSLDTLCGMEELRSQDTLNAIFTKAGEMRRNGDRAGEIALLRDAVRRYPHNEGLLSELAIALSDVSAIKNGGERERVEAILLSEQILDSDKNAKLHATTRANLCLLYLHAGQREKALSLARSLPHVWESREMILPFLVSEEERRERLAESLSVLEQVTADMKNGREFPFAEGYRG